MGCFILLTNFSWYFFFTLFHFISRCCSHLHVWTYITCCFSLQEEKDRYIGQLFGMVSVLRSQCDHDKISVSVICTRIVFSSNSWPILDLLMVVLKCWWFHSQEGGKFQTQQSLNCHPKELFWLQFFFAFRPLTQTGWAHSFPELLN